MSKGIRGLLADATTAQVSGEILFEPINNKEMELPKDREEGKAERSYLHVSKPTTHEFSKIQRLNFPDTKVKGRQASGSAAR